MSKFNQQKNELAFFQDIFEYSADAALLLENDAFLDCNRAAVKMLRAKDKAELLATTPCDLSPERQPDGSISAEKSKVMIQQALDTGNHRFEWVHRRLDGEEFPVEVSLTPISVGDRTVIHTAWREISTQKKDETKLKRLAAIVNVSNEAIFSADINGKINSWNPSAERIFGYSYNEIIGKTIHILVPPELKEEAGDILQDLKTGATKTLETIRLKKDGTRFHVRVHNASIKDANGRVIGFAITLSDITKEKEAEETRQELLTQIQESQSLLQTVIDATEDWIFVKDRNFRYLLVNKSAARDLGKEKEDFIGKDDYELGYPKELIEGDTEKGIAGIRADDLRVLNGETLHHLYDAVMIDGEPRVLDTVRIPMRNADGEITAILIFSHDITDLKNLQKKIQEAYERRGYEVQISTEISQKIAQATELPELFEQIVTLTKEQLGYYHTQLLRYEPTQNAVILVAGYGEVGKKMFAQGHHLPLGQGLIGKAAEAGETMMRSDLSADPDWQSHPLLPETRGEIAVPIKLGDTILGVLDVQSNTAGELSEDDRLLLEGLCGQIAIAMEQTRLRQEMDERLEEINRLYRTMQGKGWQSYRQGDLPGGFIYDQTVVRPLDEANITEENFTNIPMKLPGGEVIGELGIFEDEENPLAEEDKAFLEQVSTQVALALESARLFEQTQEALNEVQRLGSAVEQSVDGMAIADMDGTIQFVNRAWATMHGYTTEELIGKHLSIFHSEEQLENEVAPFNQAVAEHGVNQGEVGHQRKDGSTFPTWMTVSVMKNDEGVPVALVASAQDITERKETEKAIAKRAAELATVAEVSTAAARALNTDTLLQDVVDLTRKRFNLYHTHIYLLDKEKEVLEVKACGWEEGSPHTNRSEKHTIPLFAERSIVAQATRNRQAVVVNNVHADPNWLPNELLPKTQSEMAVPLIVGDDILGVYDIQSDELNRFTDEDVSIQTTLASQVAVALQNARSYQQAQQLAEHEALINVIGQRIQGTTSVEDALQVAVRELGRALGAKQASIQLNVGAKKKS